MQSKHVKQPLNLRLPSVIARAKLLRIFPILQSPRIYAGGNYTPVMFDLSDC